MLYRNIAPRTINPKLTALVASSIMLVGCATPLTREERIGPDDGSDICRPNVVALDSTGNFFAEDMLKGAVAGAATGGLLAALTGGSGKDIAKAVAIGGVVGAIGGYYKSRMDQGRDQGVLAISKDLSREGEELDKANTAVNALVACRVTQRDQIRVDYAAKRISRGEAQARWGKLQEQVKRDNNLMQMVAENIGKRQDEYRYANDQVVAEFDISKLTPAEQKAAKKRMVANDKMIDNDYQREVKRIDKDISKTRKMGDKKSLASLEKKKESQRIVKDQKKEANRKTGGNPNAVQVASKFSSNQSKADTTVNTAKNYQSEVAVSDNGFEKTEAHLWKDLPSYFYAINSQGIPLNIGFSWNCTRDRSLNFS